MEGASASLKEHTEPGMALEFKWNRMDSLSTMDLYEILKEREAVFVVEQQCAYQEVDGCDPQSWHLRVYADGALAAYARVVDPGLKYEEPSIGRVLTLAAFRSLKIGRALVAEAIAFTEKTHPGRGIRIGAQARLEGFYASLGFRSVGEPYDEDGILHVDMVKAA